MSSTQAHKAEAFVHRLRAEAAEGVKHFAHLPHYAGSTKTALALTLLAYTAGKRDGLKPQATELAKRDLDQEDVVKTLRLDLRWARIQIAKKGEELQSLKEELGAERKSRQQMTENEAMSADGFNGTAKADESQKHTVATDDDDMRSLKEQLKHERFEKERYKALYENLSCTSISDGHSSNENLQAKVGVLQETIDLIEEHFKETCSQLQTQLAQAEQQVHEMKLKHAIELREVEEKFLVKTDSLRYELSVREERFEQQGKDHHVQLVQAQQRTIECQAETHLVTWEKNKLLEEKDKQIAQLKQSQQKQNGCTPDQQGLMDRIKFLIQEKELQRQDWQKKLRDAQKDNSAPSIHIQSIEKMEEKLVAIELKANKNEQNLNKKVQKLEAKLSQLGPLERFLEDRDFSDEKRLHLTWDDMTYAVRAAAAGLSPQIRRTLGHGHSTYIVEEALRHGSRDLVSFALDSPGRFVLRFKFFEAVESIVDNILWEAQKFPSVRKMLKEDSTNVKMALVRHASK